jgi:hypothetical protein
MGGDGKFHFQDTVIPAKAGTQLLQLMKEMLRCWCEPSHTGGCWIPAFAGMTIFA